MNPYEFGRQPEPPACILRLIAVTLCFLVVVLFLYIAALRLWLPPLRPSALPAVILRLIIQVY